MKKNSAAENAAINLARDLCLKLIERRSLSPEQLAASLSLLSAAARNLFAEIEDGDGLWLVRLGRDFTLKMIERGQIANAQAAALALVENTRLAAETAAELPPPARIAAVGAARDLALKMAETGRLSRSGLGDLFKEIARAAGGVDVEKKEWPK